jgi:hypothetical protein
MYKPEVDLLQDEEEHVKSATRKNTMYIKSSLQAISILTAITQDKKAKMHSVIKIFSSLIRHVASPLHRGQGGKI